MVKQCKFRGPYTPVGDLEWYCVTHNVDLELKDPRKPSLAAKDYYCPGAIREHMMIVPRQWGKSKNDF